MKNNLWQVYFDRLSALRTFNKCGGLHIEAGAFGTGAM
jgi:hypothetical protein